MPLIQLPVDVLAQKQLPDEMPEVEFEAKPMTAKQVLLQSNLVESGGEDIRVIVAGDNIIGAMKRIAKSGEKRANICAGGTGERYVPGDEIKELALKTAKALDARLCAVDIIESAKGPVVLEVNINFGLQGISKATDSNIAKKIVDFIADELKSK